MKTFQLWHLALLVQTSLAQTQVATRKVPRDARIENNSITYTEPNCDPTYFPCDEVTQRCHNGFRPSLSADRRHFACCGRHQQLSGNVETGFHCCAPGHEVTGSDSVGYQCCPAGDTFNGRTCGETCGKVCNNGRTLVDGRCVCPPGTTQAFDGACQKKRDCGDCDSGLTTGKCYAFKADNGNYLYANTDGRYYADSGHYYPDNGKYYSNNGHYADNGYYADNGNYYADSWDVNDNYYADSWGTNGRYSADSRGTNGKYYADSQDTKGSQLFSKFQLCLDEKCTPGLSVNPSDRTYIRDVVYNGKPESPCSQQKRRSSSSSSSRPYYANRGHWLDQSSRSGHVRRTGDFNAAGEFSLSKWQHGKYCLGGFDWGLGPARPSHRSALSFFEYDDQMCVPLQLTEVPCDIHSNENNCAWKHEQDQYYGRFDYSDL